VTFETNDNYSIWFKISNNSSTIQFDSIRNEKHYSHSTRLWKYWYMSWYISLLVNGQVKWRDLFRTNCTHQFMSLVAIQLHKINMRTIVHLSTGILQLANTNQNPVVCGQKRSSSVNVQCHLRSVKWSYMSPARLCAKYASGWTWGNCPRTRLDVGSPHSVPVIQPGTFFISSASSSRFFRSCRSNLNITVSSANQ